MSEEMPLIDPAAREKSRCTLAATGSQQEPRHGRRHTVLIWQLKADEVHALKSTEMNIFETVLGILLILAVGMCVVTFPFVFWMLFGGEPRSRHSRYTSRQRPIGTRDRSSQKAPAKYDETEE
jgi:hypothetical protein